MRVQTIADIIEIKGVEQVKDSDVFNAVCRDADGLEFDIAYWDDVGAWAAKEHLKVGDRVMISGKVRIRRRENKNGEERLYLILDARQLGLVLSNM